MSPARRRLLASLALAAALGTAAAAAAPAVRTGTLETPDGTLFYELHGEGPPIVLVAGGPGAPRTSLRPEFDRLARTHTVVYFDNLGRGRSSDLAPGRRHSPERDAEDIERLRRHLGFERFSLLGHSYGGYPALAYAGKHPQRLARLVISSSGHSAESWQRNIDNVNRFVENQYPEVWAKLQSLRARGVKSCDPDYQEVYGEPVAQLYWHDPSWATRRTRVSDDPRDTFRPRTYCDIAGEDSEVRVGGSLATFDARPALAAVRVPTLVTAGRYDVVCPPKVAHEIAAAFPAGVAKVRVFDRSSHRPWVEENATYFEELEAFLR